MQSDLSIGPKYVSIHVMDVRVSPLYLNVWFRFHLRHNLGLRRMKRLMENLASY